MKIPEAYILSHTTPSGKKVYRSSDGVTEFSVEENENGSERYTLNINENLNFSVHSHTDRTHLVLPSSNKVEAFYIVAESKLVSKCGGYEYKFDKAIAKIMVNLINGVNNDRDRELQVPVHTIRQIRKLIRKDDYRTFCSEGFGLELNDAEMEKFDQRDENSELPRLPRRINLLIFEIDGEMLALKRKMKNRIQIIK